MESLKEIRTMNAKHPAGRLPTCVEDLCARVEALEKENRELRENARQAPPAPICATEAPVCDGPAALPSDDLLIGFLGEQPRRSLAQICEHFGVPYCYSPAHPRNDGAVDGYTEESSAIRNQLQRLRRAGKIRCESTRWEVR